MLCNHSLDNKGLTLLVCASARSGTLDSLCSTCLLCGFPRTDSENKYPLNMAPVYSSPLHCLGESEKMASMACSKSTFHQLIISLYFPFISTTSSGIVWNKLAQIWDRQRRPLSSVSALGCITAGSCTPDPTRRETNPGSDLWRWTGNTAA